MSEGGRSASPDLRRLLASDRTLRQVAPRILSALQLGDRGARYDRRAATYDRLIANALYNRLAWGASPSAYRAFASEAADAGDGAMLDAGCGTATFTAAAYRRRARSAVLVDRSVDMLDRAAQRLPGAEVTFVQADLLDLPFAPRCFTTVACFGLLHVVEDPWAALAALREQIAVGGCLFASMLVADRRPSALYLAGLHRAGEVGRPRRMDELGVAVHELFGPRADVRRSGAMAWVRAELTASPAPRRRAVADER